MDDSEEGRRCARCRAPERMLPSQPGDDHATRRLRYVTGAAIGQVDQTVPLCDFCIRALYGDRWEP